MQRKSRAFSFEADSSAWGGASADLSTPFEEVDINPADVLEKESIIKEIVGMQEGLKAMLERVTEVQGEGAKLKSENEMLQTYIDNLTRNKQQEQVAKLMRTRT